MKNIQLNATVVNGAFVNLGDERYYAIGNVDNMPPFFISLVSDSDHWLFISSNGFRPVVKKSNN